MNKYQKRVNKRTKKIFNTCYRISNVGFTKVRKELRKGINECRKQNRKTFLDDYLDS